MIQSQSHSDSTRGSDGMESRRIRLPGGGSGYALGPEGSFDLAKVKAWLDRPDRLAESGGEVLKTDRGTLVVRRPVEFAGRAVDCVIKFQRYDRRFADRLRGLFALRAVSGFRQAVRLLNAGIATPRALLAVEQRGGFCYPQSLLITEYIPDSIHLYGYLRDHLAPTNPSFARIKRSLAAQVASVFLGLDRLGLRHRDAKPSNWLVQTTPDGPRLWLIDLDGIRAKRLSANSAMDGLAQLASKLLWSPLLYRTDYLRVFQTCFGSDPKMPGEWKSRFGRAARLAVARRVQTLAETMLSQPGHLRQGRVHA
jgi:hypothetical protein